MRLTHRPSLLFFVLCILLLDHLSATTPGVSKSKTFRLDPLTDSILLGGGLLLNAGSLLIEKESEPIGGWVFDSSSELATVNSIDRLFMNSFSEPLDKASTILTFGALLTPAVLLTAPDSEWLTIGTMYAESLMWAWGLKELGKNLIHRNRPYMYTAGYPEDEIKNGDFQQSFPSGHTTLAFTGASFSTCVFRQYFSDSPWRIPVMGVSYSLAIGSSILRVASGSHFLSDVLAGALIGTFSGFMIPFFHRVNNDTIKGEERDSLSIDVVPNGMNFRLSY